MLYVVRGRQCLRGLVENDMKRWKLLLGSAAAALGAAIVIANSPLIV